MNFTHESYFNQVNADFLKKANGYHPFLYNVSTDFCQVMRRKNIKTFIDFVINLMAKDTNINHTCPYDVS